MSGTPRSDKAVKGFLLSTYVGQEIVLANFARELERELADKTARIKILEGCIDDMQEEQAAICAEDESITEVVARKDAALLEQAKRDQQAQSVLREEIKRLEGLIEQLKNI